MARPPSAALIAALRGCCDQPAYYGATGLFIWSELPRVAVIGAGMAGILAAIWLRESGHDVVVYEKADRLGGICRGNT